MSAWDDPQYRRLRMHVYAICKRVERDQHRINEGKRVFRPDRVEYTE